MKHALLITAYKNISYLLRLVNTFDSDFRIYIHLDKKSTATDGEIELLRKHPLVCCVDQVYQVNWGGTHHIDSILYLCSKALENSDNQYFHLISGADLLTKNLILFKRFFSDHRNENFMEYFPLPADHWAEGGLNRLEWYHPLDRINIQKTEDWELYQRYLRRQKNAGCKRLLPAVQFYGGSSWWSLSRACIAYVVENKNWNNLYDCVQCTFAPDEIYFQTMILNSPFASSVNKNNLRYICWEVRNGNIPAILDKTDLVPIHLSGCFFARKVDPEISNELLTTFDAVRSRNRWHFFLQEKNDRINLEKVARILYQEIDKWPSVDLMCGRLGICLFLFHYGRVTGIKAYSKKAYKGLCSVIKASKTNIDRTYCTGAMGIATGIEYLRNRGFIDLNTDKLLSNIDKFTQKVLVNVASGELSRNCLIFYRFDLYVNERQRNQPIFNEWLPLEYIPERHESVRKNRLLLGRLFRHPEEMSYPGIIGLAGWGWTLLHREHPEYPLDNVLFSDYLSLNELEE